MRLPADIVAKLRPAYEGVGVCVTGGAGFIGGHLVDALLGLGASITVLDDLSNSDLSHLSELIDLEPDRVRFVHASVLDDDATAAAAAGARIVFHLAAMGSVPRSIAEPQRAWSVNATGTLRILEAARTAKAARVVFAASSSAYGDDPTLPKVETQTPRPLSPYAASKAAGESLMSAWATAYGLSTVSLRYFNVFGPRQSADSAYAAVVAAFATRLLAGRQPVIFGDGSQSRDFTFVSNAVLATLLAGASPKPLSGEVFNVGTGRRVTVLELAELMRSLIVRQEDVAPPSPEFVPARVGDVKHSLADLTRISQALGYAPFASLEAGLAETIAWYRDLATAAQRARGV